MILSIRVKQTNAHAYVSATYTWLAYEIVSKR